MTQKLQDTLSWPNYTALARILDQSYPDIDRTKITKEKLHEIILALPDFEDSFDPPTPDYLDAVHWAWLSLGEEEA